MDIYKQLTGLDFGVMTLYVVTLIALGSWISFRKRQKDDHLFLAQKSLGATSIGFSMWGTNVGPSMLIASASGAYSAGIVIGNFSWYAIPFLLLLAMVFAPLYLKTGISTLPEFVGRRFNETSRELLAWYSLITILISWLGVNLYVSGLLLSQIMNWPLWLSCVALVSLSVFLTVAGGLKTVAQTNIFQMSLIIIAGSILTVVAFLKAGGISALVEGVPREHWNLFKPASDADYPWYAILLGYPVLGVWFWCTDQSMVQSVLGARNQRQGQLGANLAGWLKLLDVPLFILPGILCVVLYPHLENKDEAYMTMVSDLLPAGMIGLIISVLVAGLVSTIASALNSLGTILTLDIYVKRVRPDASKREIVKLGRIVAVAGAILAVLIALGVDQVKDMDLFGKLQAILAFLAPPMTTVFLVGVLWKRATATAANVILTFGSVGCIGIGICNLAGWPSKEFWPHFLFLSFLICVGLCVVMVLVSLGTRQEQTGGIPSIREASQDEVEGRRFVWAAWVALIAVLIGLYVFFN